MTLSFWPGEISNERTDEYCTIQYLRILHKAKRQYWYFNIGGLEETQYCTTWYLLAEIAQELKKVSLSND